jgi:uncharacterized protein
MAKKKTAKKKRPNKIENDKNLFAFLATFLSIIGFIIVLIAKRDDKYVMFYAKQSLVIFIMAIIAGFISGILVFLPVIGWIISAALHILIFLAWLLSWIYALSGEMKDVPLAGDYAKKFNL